MGWGLRRSLKLGPLKLNFSKSGVGYSVGVRGFRVGKDARGRSYTAASIPGTGLYNRSYSSSSSSSSQTEAPGSGAPSQQKTGNGAALVVAFIAGGLLVLFLTAVFSSHPATPSAAAPAAVSAPATPPAPVKPAKRRRVHRHALASRSKPADAPATSLPSNSPASQTQPAN
jgi:hypothetical protein